MNEEIVEVDLESRSMILYVIIECQKRFFGLSFNSNYYDDEFFERSLTEVYPKEITKIIISKMKIFDIIIYISKAKKVPLLDSNLLIPTFR